ncbi:MAG TPA: 4Fe-4S dicluster domain-containing protein [bacterium]|nr:4Fe-4S dicluster domain-containing protein [bacterium]
MTPSSQIVRPSPASPARPIKWAKVIDHTRCIGCHACTTACKSENEVPLSVTRTYVKCVDVGTFPHSRRAFQVTRCNQCDDAPCVTACPTTAMYRRPDGIVDFDKSICIGCKACIAACPYDAIFINPDDHSAEKCNFCAHRIDVGLEPACVVVCPTEAILVGDLHDPASRVAQIVNREPVAVRRPEKATRPKLFYKGAHQATLDPLAAQRPEGGLFMWSEQGRFPDQVPSGHPNGWANSSAAALLSYDVPHVAPWTWRVSLYTWTKGIAAGVYLIPLLLILGGWLSWTSALWLRAAPIVAGVFLAATGGLLIADLKHPERFYLIFTRPQWSSWLVRGAFIIAAYSAVLALHILAALLGWGQAQRALAFPGLPLAVLSAVYTAYLFAQAKARDLWQNPLLPPHLLLQAALAGTAATLPLAAWLEPGLVRPLLWMLGGASLLQLLCVWGEASLTHATAHAQLAAYEMTTGRYRGFFWTGIGLGAAALLASWIGLAASFPDHAAGMGAAAAALAGLLLYEHAYVQAGQAVPLA